MSMSVLNPTLRVSGNFDTPIWNGAIFHQSTFNNLFTKGLSFTVGLRLDYEKMSMKYNSASDPLNFDFNFAMGPMVITAKDLIADAAYNGKLSEDYVQLLPKFALQYEWRKGNNVYATVSKGYRSGGYNVQMFSDIITGQQAHSMVEAIKKAQSSKNTAH